MFVAQMNPNVIILIVGGAVAVFFLMQCFDIVIVATEISRFIRTRIRHSKYIVWPEDLKIASANRLISVGSELIVGNECEWAGLTVRRFAISPTDAREEAGSILRIIGMTRDEVEVTRITQANRCSARHRR